MSIFVFANNVNTTLAAAASNTATTLTLASSANLPTLSAGQIMPLTINDAATGLIYEVVYVTAITGASLTVMRGQEGTTAQNWSIGDYAFSTVTEGSLAFMVQEVELQNAQYVAASAAGTSDAITATFTPAISALTAGMTLYVRAGSANTTTTPTFTPNSGTLAAKNIVKGAGSALAAGDIAGAGHWLTLQYDLTLDKWVLLNPATGVSITHNAQVQSIPTPTFAAGAMTISSSQYSLDFRSATLGSGVVTNVTGSPAALVVPSGATLGTISGQQSTVMLLVMDNAGTLEYAVVNLAGGVDLSETGLLSTTAISASATAANVVYSTTSRTNLPYRVIGEYVSTQTTAGVWATAPTTVQGVGGNALTAMSSLGYGQTYTVYSPPTGRAAGTTYYSGSKPITVIVVVSAVSGTFTPSVGGTNLAAMTTSASYFPTYTFIVPPRTSYSIAVTGCTILTWTELS